jgi:hypothetical protein
MDIMSRATFTSVMTDDQGQRGWLRIPAFQMQLHQGHHLHVVLAEGNRRTSLIEVIGSSNPQDSATQNLTNIITGSMYLQILNRISAPFRGAKVELHRSRLESSGPITSFPTIA